MGGHQLGAGRQEEAATGTKLRSRSSSAAVDIDRGIRIGLSESSSGASPTFRTLKTCINSSPEKTSPKSWLVLSMIREGEDPITRVGPAGEAVAKEVAAESAMASKAVCFSRSLERLKAHSLLVAIRLCR